MCALVDSVGPVHEPDSVTIGVCLIGHSEDQRVVYNQTFTRTRWPQMLVLNIYCEYLLTNFASTPSD